MNLKNLSTQLLYATVPLLVEKHDNSKTSGTGFIYNAPYGDKSDTVVPLIVTNRHVIENTKRGIFQFVASQDDKPIRDKRIRVEFDTDFFNSHVDPDIDLAAAPIYPLLTQLEQNNVTIFYRAIDSAIVPNRDQLEALGAVEDVLFIGYPSGLFDMFNATPIVRRGITATPVWNNYNNEKKFLIDAGVFPGSSGSPVFILNEGGYTSGGNFVVGTRLYFLGVLSDTMLNTSSRSERYFIGLGSVINSESVRSYLKGLIGKLSP